MLEELKLFGSTMPAATLTKMYNSLTNGFKSTFNTIIYNTSPVISTCNPTTQQQKNPFTPYPPRSPSLTFAAL